MVCATARARPKPRTSPRSTQSELRSVQTDPSGDIIYVNPAASALLGMSHEHPAVKKNFAEFTATATLRQVIEIVLPALRANGVWVGETWVCVGDRCTVPFSVMALAHRSAEGRTVRFSAVMRDISEDVKARLHIERQNNILGAITEALPATVVIVDSQGRYRFVNSAFERYVGRPAHQILGKTAVEILGQDEVARRKPYMRKAMAGEPVEFTLDYPGPDGPTYLSLNCIPLNLDGTVDGFVGISQDVTLRHREQERLVRLAERDPLTGLLNRSGLELRAVQPATSEAHQQALLYIDLDHFKPVNDQFGHAAGDQLLQMFARRLAEVVRSSDVVARLGGDEFVVLLKGGCGLAAAEAVGAKILKAASAPFDIDGRRVNVSASIGVVVVDRGAWGLPEMLLRADALLYRAKAAGRGRQISQTRELVCMDQPGD